MPPSNFSSGLWELFYFDHTSNFTTAVYRYACSLFKHIFQSSNVSLSNPVKIRSLIEHFSSSKVQQLGIRCNGALDSTCVYS